MVLSNKDSLTKELEERKEMLSIRISTIEKQEDKFRTKIEDLQKEVMKNLEDKNSPDKKKSKSNNKQQ
jgi:chaperonin cofactor prefoldin